MANKVPEIRFAGFEGDWDNLPLSEYLTTSKAKNRDNRFGKEDVLSVSREYGVINQIAYQGRSFAGASVAGYGVVETNDIVYTKSPLRDQPYGIIKTNKDIPGIVSALYAIYHPNENVEPDFIQTFFDKDKRLNDYLRPIVHKGAKNTLNIGDDEALHGIVRFPIRDEQIKITESFRNIDDLISQQKIECEKLRQNRSALLSRMIPSLDNSRPVVRLEEFTDEWVVTELSSFLEISKEKNIQNEYTVTDVLSVSQYAGIVNQIEFQGKSLAGASLSGYKILRTNQVVYTKSPLKEQPYGIIKVNLGASGIVSSLYAVYDCIQSDGKFIELYFSDSNRLNQYLRVLVRKGAKNTMNISDSDTLLGSVIFPSLKEQQAIAKIFEEYDRLIRLNEQKLEKLRNLKQAMLDKMFV